MNYNAKQAEEIIQKILVFKKEYDRPMVDIINRDYIINLIEEKSEIEVVQQYLHKHAEEGVDLVDFIKIFLNVVSHGEDETIYLTIALIDLFKDICETYNLKDRVGSADILNYIVDNAPLILGSNKEGFRRLSASKVYTDNYHHQNRIVAAFYAKDHKALFALDALGGSITRYNMNCVVDKIIEPKALDGGKSKSLIMSFFYSSRHNRIGACLKDYRLCFWEANDNFELEKSFSVGNHAAEYQTNIWFIDYLDFWLTYDKTNTLNAWSIETETKLFSLTSKQLKSEIIDLLEIEVLKLVAISTMDRKITFWDLHKKRCVTVMSFEQGGLHSMIWCNQQQCLVTAGYNNSLQVWNFNIKFLDYQLVGKLIGHMSMVTAITGIEKSPMVVSIDDKSNIKIWDVRNLVCMQTVHLGTMITTTKLIGIMDQDKLCLVGSRVSFLEFDPQIENNPLKPGRTKESIYPVRCELNSDTKEIVVCTSKELMFVDMLTGRVKRVQSGILEAGNDNNELVNFRLTDKNKRIVVADHKGRILTYQYINGEQINYYKPHRREVTGLKYDVINKLLISCSADSGIHIHVDDKSQENGTEILRGIKNVGFKKEVTAMEVSVYHNLIVATVPGRSIYCFDFEFCKLQSVIELPDQCEAVAFHFVMGYPILIISDNRGNITAYQFKKIEQMLEFKKIADISKFDKTLIDDRGHLSHGNKLLMEFVAGGNVYESVKTCDLYVGMTRGEIKKYDLLSLFDRSDIKSVEHINSKASYNPLRKGGEDFEAASVQYKYSTYKAGEDKNPEIQNLAGEKKLEFKAHNDHMTSMSLINTKVKKLLTSSWDSTIKIFTAEGKLLCSLNINHPLPMIWNFQEDGLERHRNKVIYALKILHLTNHRYRHNMMKEEKSNISIVNFLRELAMEPKIFSNTELEVSQQKKKVITLAEEYDKRDLLLDTLKQLFQTEVQGPSLKQLEGTKRVTQAQSLYRNKSLSITDLQDKVDQYNSILEDRREKAEFMDFMMGKRDYKSPDKIYTKKVNELSDKLDTCLKFPLVPETPSSHRFNQRNFPTFQTSQNTQHTQANSIQQLNSHLSHPTIPTGRSHESQDLLSPKSLKSNLLKTAEESMIIKKTDETTLIHNTLISERTKFPKSPKPKKVSNVEVKMRPKVNVNFWDYASTKYNSDFNVTMNSNNSAKSTVANSHDVTHGEIYQRKKENSDFQNILKTMNNQIKMSKKPVGMTTMTSMSNIKSPNMSMYNTSLLSSFHHNGAMSPKTQLPQIEAVPVQPATNKPTPKKKMQYDYQIFNGDGSISNDWEETMRRRSESNPYRNSYLTTLGLSPKNEVRQGERVDEFTRFFDHTLSMHMKLESIRSQDKMKESLLSGGGLSPITAGSRGGFRELTKAVTKKTIIE